MVQLQKYTNTFLIVIFVVFPQTVQNVVALTHFFARCAYTLKYTNTFFICECLLLVFIKGKLVLPLRETGYVWKETRQKFIENQNFYFHFYWKSFCTKAVYLSYKRSLTCPRLWSTERKNVSFYTYFLKTSFERGAYFGKMCVNATQFWRVLEKQRRLEFKCSCWQFCS